MKISRTTLQSFFEDKLPSDEKIVDIFTFGAFEVEGVEKYDREFDGKKVTDTVFDLKVLPDRACYALSWQGIAYEFSALSRMKMKSAVFNMEVSPEIKLDDVIQVNVDPKSDCNRQLAVCVSGFGAITPSWMVAELDKVGQRSISAVVDVTNYVMYMIGQPLHAFDANKVKGGIFVRKASKGESITLLDGTVKVLDDTMTVLADSDGALDIAGVKGGKRAEVTSSTKKIILVASSFDSVSIRRTSTKVGIKNDAAKRFENSISGSLSNVGLMYGLNLIALSFPTANFGKITDVVLNDESESKPLAISLHAVNTVLGTSISVSEVKSCLEALLFKVEVDGENLIVSAPVWRKDIKISEDLYEEIGRVYGYSNIPAILPPPSVPRAVNATFYLTEWIKNLLVERGFSEVILYTLGNDGHYETAYPVASDKGILRSSLSKNLKTCLEENTRNNDYLGLEDILIFEIGRVFDGKADNGTQDGEHIHLALAASLSKASAKRRKISPSEFVIQVLGEVSKAIGFELQGQVSSRDNQALVEVPLDAVIAKFASSGAMPNSYSALSFGKTPYVKYVPVSPYPYSVRDVAFFVHGNIDEAERERVNQSNMDIIKQNAGDILVSVRLFDVFTKAFESKSDSEGTPVISKSYKTSYAYRLILQSKTKTLTENEINGSMERVYNALKSAGFEIR